MIESFVDLTYRGLALGRRIKLTQVRPSTAYLELTLPMPVGTQVAIASDEGIVLEATVIQLHEQIGGSDRAPGMTIRPVLGDPSSAAASWWQARVGLPELERPESPRAKQVTVRPRTQTLEMPPPAAAIANEPATERMAPMAEPTPVPQVADHAVADDGKRTTIMNAVEQELLEQLSSSSGELERLTSTSGEMPVVDDGKKTIVMESVDVSALGLETGATGAFNAIDDDDGDDDGRDGSTNGSPDPKSGKRRKQKR